MGASLPDSVLNSKTTHLLLPLSESETVELATSQVVQKENGRIILFGQLANGERSHSSLVFDGGKLTSGSLTFFDSEEQYLITSLPDGKVALTLTDPDIHVPSCGCEECLEQSS